MSLQVDKISDVIYLSIAIDQNNMNEKKSE